ncbi:MAG: RCC1 domain-containing protein [Burkholderiales bacterium]
MKVNLTTTFLLLFLASPWAGASALIAGGGSHSLAIDHTHNDRVLAWGDNSKGQLGTGTTTSSSYPVAVYGLTKTQSIATRLDFSLSSDQDGYAWAWGSNTSGQLGDYSTTNRLTPVRVSGLKNVIQVAAGNAFSLALKGDGSVWSWGSNSKGQLGVGVTTPPTTQSTYPLQISASGFSSIQKLSAGSEFALALKSDGTVWSWGANARGQLGNGNTTAQTVPVQVLIPSGTAIVDIAACDLHALALDANGTVWAWGANDAGQLGDDTTVDRYTPKQALDLQNVGGIACTSTGSVALARDGSIWTWGTNDKGQLLDGTSTQRHYPVKAQGPANIIEVAAGAAHVLALRSSGEIAAWGDNTKGQLGSGDTKVSFNAPLTAKADAANNLNIGSATVPQGSVSGTLGSLNVSASIPVSDLDRGQMGQYFVAALVPNAGTYYLNILVGWTQSATPIPYQGIQPLQNASVSVLRNLDASGIVGAQIYAGYGLNYQDMLNGQKYGLIYTIK